jgi:Ca2+-binding RTX toxin-like protein
VGDDTLDGGQGADLMRGGKGNDTYIVDNAGDRIFEVDSHPIANDSTHDIVLASISYTLPDEVEDITLTGTASIAATGNDMDNIIIGNSGNNILTGGLGYDVMTGGAGADFFVYNSIFESGTLPFSGFFDYIMDFSAGEGDRIDLRAIDANPNTGADDPFVFIGDINTNPFTAVGQVAYQVLSNGTNILINTDADPSAEMVIRVVNGGAANAGWFLL